MLKRTARCNDGVAKGWTGRSDCACSAYRARKKGRRRKPSAGMRKADAAGSTQSMSLLARSQRYTSRQNSPRLAMRTVSLGTVMRPKRLTVMSDVSGAAGRTGETAAGGEAPDC